ncbi:hypothetical protein [Hymenobacter sp. HDW8]|uniref:hypothetical protein n=1 Tax=Hymenobacter sp. HDW8 TaxID=2714932 RepID=UPI001409E6FA|nr:hypothetical protein [Hymenobacter sp. HDW8]QIL75008.1 hypothetical protein G7064_03415 [Hymenobacter sp. HDW8]
MYIQVMSYLSHFTWYGLALVQPSATSKFCPQKLTVGVEVVVGASACPKAKDEQNNKTRVQILFMAINMRIIRLSQKYSIQQLANY